MTTREIWLNARDDVVDFIWCDVNDTQKQDLSAVNVHFWVGVGTYSTAPEGTSAWNALESFDMKVFPSLGKARIGYLVGTDAQVAATACHAIDDGTHEMWMIIGDTPTTTPFRCGKVIVHK